MSLYNKTKKTSLIPYFGTIGILRILLDASYKIGIATKFSYMGFADNASDFYLIVSWIVLLSFVYFARFNYINENNKLSLEIVFWLFIFSFIPFTSLICFGTFTAGFIIWNCIYWFILLVFSREFSLAHKYKFVFLNKEVVNDAHIRLFAVFSFLIVLYVSGRYAHFRLNFNLLNVYDLRMEARGYSLPTIIEYAFLWTRTINSIFVAYFIRKKRWGWAVACFFVQLLNFGVDGSKTTLFLAIFAVAISLMPKLELKKINKWILIGISVLTLICFILFQWFDNLIPLSIVIRRVFFVPPFIQRYYFDFFTTHSPDFFRQSFLRHFGFVSPYPNIPYMIGNIYFNQNSMSANNGLISDGMANMGYFGVFAMPILLSIILKCLDRVSAGLDIRLYITVALYTSIVLTNSFLLTVLLTHGLLIVMILLKTMTRDKETRDIFNYSNIK